MKKTKKIGAIICMSIVLMITATTVVAAHNFGEGSFIEVVFSQNSIFTDEEKQTIEASFNEDVPKAQPYGLKCTLFGHNYKTEIIDVIRHKVSTEQPRCIKDKYETKICTVCSDTVSTLIFSDPIYCCD